MAQLDSSISAPSRSALPPGPRLPGLVQLLLMFVRPTAFLRDCVAKYGHTFTLKVPGLPPFIQTSEPAAVEAIFKGHPDIFHGGKANIGLKPVVGANSLLLLDGKRHRHERKLIVPILASERIHAYGGAIRAIITRHIDRWPVNKPFALHPETQDVTLEIILRLVFGFDDAQKIATFRDKIHQVLKLAILLFPDANGDMVAGALVRRLGRLFSKLDVLAALDKIDDLIYREIEARRQSDLKRREDVLSLMMQASYDDGAAMSRQELRDELMTLLFAGHETSATILAWCIYHLSRHAEILERLRDEVAAIGGGGPIPPQGLSELPYLDAVLKETMRITPVFSLVARVLKEPQTLGGTTYPANVVLSPDIYSTHHRADIWEEPDAFRPERFLRGKASPFHYFPFGGGVRKCIGMSFAYYEMKIFVSEMVRRTCFTTPAGYRAKVIRRNNTLAPSRGVPILINSRSP